MGALKKLLQQVRIEWLKWRARNLYYLYQKELGRYDCGRKMAMEVNPRLRSIARTFNMVMGELSLLDPNAPKDRL